MILKRLMEGTFSYDIMELTYDVINVHLKITSYKKVGETTLTLFVKDNYAYYESFIVNKY